MGINIEARYREDAHVSVRPVWQWDANIGLKVAGAPAGAVCAFWATSSADSKVVEASGGVYKIPNSLLAGKDRIHAVLTIGDGSASMGAMGISIPVMPRPKPADYVPSSDEHVIQASTVVAAAQAWATAASGYATNASSSADVASAKATAASGSASAASASASQAAASKAAADDAASRAQGWAANAKEHADSCSHAIEGVEAYADTAAEKAVAAANTKVDAAVAKAEAAATKAASDTSTAITSFGVDVTAMVTKGNASVAAMQTDYNGIKADYASKKAEWGSEVSSLLATGATYENRIAAAEAELAGAKTGTRGASFASIGDRMTAIERTVSAVGSDVSLDMSALSGIIAAGTADFMFPVGSVLTYDWTDSRTDRSTVWANGFNVVDHSPVAVDANGTTVKAMTVQQRLTLPFVTQFDPRQAFYAAPEGGLPAGDYCIEIGTTYRKVTAGDIYAFTTTVDLPEGGQLEFASSIYDYSPVNAGIRSYASGASTTALETLTVTQVDGTEGYSSLGTITANNVDYDGNVNHVHRIALGGNRWAKSALRQYLNATGTGWFQPATKWSRPPSYAGYRGYLSGFDEELVEHMRAVAVKTALPYCDGGTSGGTQHDLTLDRVFLPSMEQLYGTSTTYGVPYGLEGSAWAYWKDVAGTDTPTKWGTTVPAYIMYGMGAETTARHVFERSAGRDNGTNVSFCSTSGILTTNYAYNGCYCAPACCIV